MVTLIYYFCRYAFVGPGCGGPTRGGSRTMLVFNYTSEHCTHTSELLANPGHPTQPQYEGLLTLKPIFHCDAKLLVSGNFALPNAKDSTFASPNSKNTNMLVSLALGDANFSRHLTQNTQRESVEYRLRWVPNAKSSRWPCTFHVVCVYFICILWPTQTQFSVKYGL